MAGRRTIILEALDLWRSEGSIDEATYARLRARYDAAPDDEPETLPQAEGRASFGLLALQLVGGLLLGAAAVALVLFLELEERAGAVVLALLGAAAIGGGYALRRVAGARGPGLADAALAAGLVAVSVGGFFPDDDTWAAVLGAALALVATLAVQGRSPVTALAAVAFAVSSGRAVLPGFGGDGDLLRPALWWVALAGYLVVLLVLWRRHGWTSAAAALLVAPLTIAAIMILDALGVGSSTAMELAVGLYLGVFVVVGIWLGERGLVAGAVAGLLIDAIVFAFDVGGAGTALVVLLALGGLLVWQAEVLRSYFRRRAPRGPA